MAEAWRLKATAIHRGPGWKPARRRKIDYRLIAEFLGGAGLLSMGFAPMAGQGLKAEGGVHLSPPAVPN